METIRFDTSENSTIVIRSVGGDLRVTGRQGEAFEAQAPEHGRMVASQNGNRIELDCRSSCLVFLPAQSTLQVESIGGDGRVTAVQGSVSLGTVGGDLVIRRVQDAEVKRVGGDLDARRIDDTLQVGWVGGDAMLERCSGQVSIQGVGGDLKIRKSVSAVDATAGGDVQLDMDVLPGSSSSIQAGGDLMCRLPGAASGRVALAAGGDVLFAGAQESSYEDGEADIVLGGGDAKLQLTAGGDLMRQAGESRKGGKGPLDDDFLSDLDATLEETDQRIAEMEARLGAVGLGFSMDETERIGSEVRRAVERALRRKGGATIHVGTRGKGRNFKFDLDLPGSHTTQPSEEEKLSILKMVEAGTISIEEADMLLKALEGKQ